MCSSDLVISQTLKDIQRKKYDLSIIMFDIDFFKKINDEFGHLAGDAQIKNIATIVMNLLRDSDIVCRWGGEEFVILLKECGLDEAYKMSEKIRKTVKKSPITYQDREIFSTISLGVTQYNPLEEQDDLILRVDKLMYLAKEKGRDRSEKQG